MISIKVRTYRLTIIFLICCFITACSGSPDENEPGNPKVGDDTYTIEEDELLSVPKEQGLLSNDSPEAGQSATIVTTDQEQTTDQDGVIIIAADGGFTYEPAPNFNGKDQISYLVENDKGKQSQGTVFFEVTPVNDPPEPQDDIIQTPIEETITIPVLDNDADPDGDEIHLVNVVPPSIGAAQANNDGTVLYIPPDNHEGDVRIRYTVADTADEQAEAWISITVFDRNQNIEANPDSLTLTENTPGTFPTSDLLANDRNFLNGALSVIEVGEAENGITTLEGQTFTYTPNAGFSGSDIFTYTAQSEADATASSTVNVTVTPVNDPPTISPIPDQTIMAGETANVQFTIEDLDNPFSELNVEAEISNSNPPNLLAPDSLTINGSEGPRILRIATNPELHGSTVITVNVNDGQESSSQPFSFTVTPLVGDTPLYRFWNESTGDHLYTISDHERTQLIGNPNWIPEGLECYVFSSPRPGTIPLYRLRRINHTDPIHSDHLYTASEDERDQLVGSGNWILEGGPDRVAFYVFESQGLQGSGRIQLYRCHSRVVWDHFYTTDMGELPDPHSHCNDCQYYMERAVYWVSPAPSNR
jgi:hypothetical protein